MVNVSTVGRRDTYRAIVPTRRSVEIAINLDIMPVTARPVEMDVGVAAAAAEAVAVVAAAVVAAAVAEAAREARATR